MNVSSRMVRERQGPGHPWRRAAVVTLLTTAFLHLPSPDVRASGDDGRVANRETAGVPPHGIEPRSVRLSAAGYMLDFRYRVVDPERAIGAVNEAVRPYLVDAATGFRVGIPAPPKIGPLRHTGNDLSTKRTYFMLFANPARRIKRGDRVSVVLGEHRIDDLIVQ